MNFNFYDFFQDNKRVNRAMYIGVVIVIVYISIKTLIDLL